MRYIYIYIYTHIYIHINMYVYNVYGICHTYDCWLSGHLFIQRDNVSCSLLRDKTDPRSCAITVRVEI